MEKINVAEILKDCPSGMELDCVMYENVYFDKINDDKKSYYPIFCYITDEKGNRSSILFTKNGCESIRYGAKCVIFPKGKTTWEGFVPPCQFKDGDIVASGSGLWIGITTGGEISSFIPTYCVIKHNGEFKAYLGKKETWQFRRLATEEEKQKLFDAIKSNGYKWNPETKTLEKLVEPKFEIGNKIEKCGYRFTIAEVKDDYYLTKCGNKIPINNQDDFSLVPNKFGITTLKPFDKVLVRMCDTDIWECDIFSTYSDNYNCKFHCIGSYYNQCIPYEANKELLGTTKDCDEYYKNW